jgi:hypothetical protein
MKLKFPLSSESCIGQRRIRPQNHPDLLPKPKELRDQVKPKPL